MSVIDSVVTVVPSTFRGNPGESKLVAHLAISTAFWYISPDRIRPDSRRVTIRLVTYNHPATGTIPLAMPKEARG